MSRSSLPIALEDRMIEAGHVQTKKEIEAVLASAGASPLKRFGQNFLIDGNHMRRLADCAELVPGDCVLEVGPGTGGLTDLLFERCATVVCVEIDRALAAIVRDRFAARSHVSVIEGDVLSGKHRLNQELVDAFARAGEAAVWKLVANLPYQAATPLVLNLLVDVPQVRRLCFTVQAELAERMIARSGREFGPLAIIVQTVGRVEIVARLGPQLFWPRPQVDSAMVRIDVEACPPALAGPGRVRAFAEFVRGIFDHRRKTLRSALGYVVDDAVRQAVCDRHDAARRPEQCGVAEWLAMFEIACPVSGPRP